MSNGQISGSKSNSLLPVPIILEHTLKGFVDYLKGINFCEHKFSRSLILAHIYFRKLAQICENLYSQKLMSLR